MNQAMEFKLRPWTKNDVGCLIKYANNWHIAKNMTDKFPHPYTEADGLAFVELATAESPIHIFAIDVNKEAVGGIGIHPQTDIHQKNAELGYWLAEPFWGRGIISTAIKRVVDFAFDTYIIDRVFAKPFGTNIALQRVLEKNGFVLEGHFKGTLYKDGEFIDELVYAIRKQNIVSNGAEVLDKGLFYQGAKADLQVGPVELIPNYVAGFGLTFVRAEGERGLPLGKYVVSGFWYY